MKKLFDKLLHFFKQHELFCKRCSEKIIGTDALYNDNVYHKACLMKHIVDERLKELKLP